MLWMRMNIGCRGELHAACKAKASQVLALNNTVLGLKRDLEVLAQEILALESGKDAVLAAATQKISEHGQVSIAMTPLVATQTPIQ